MGDASISITPWHATIFAELGRVRLDVVDEIVYDQGRFFASSHPVGTPPISRTELGGPELRDLAAQLEAQLDHSLDGIEARAIRAFLALIPDTSILTDKE